MGKDFAWFLNRTKCGAEAFPLGQFEYVDSNPELWGKYLVAQIKIQSPDSINHIEDFFCVISSRNFFEDIKGILHNKYRVPEQNICSIDSFYTKTIIEYQFNMFRNRKHFKQNKRVASKTVVYTAIFSAYDTLKDPLFVDKNVDYICFTDQEYLESSIWKIIQVERDLRFSAKMQAERYKILPHVFLRNYETSVWVDASLTIKASIIEYITQYNKTSEILLFPHPERICIYDEAAVCMLSGKDDKNVIIQQIARYYNEGYKTNSGLFCGGVLVRNHNNPEVIKVMELWYEEIKLYSERDQISLPFVLNKMEQDIDLCDLNIFDNSFFSLSEHLNIL
jgi:hypothetical protein